MHYFLALPHVSVEKFGYTLTDLRAPLNKAKVRTEKTVKQESLWNVARTLLLLVSLTAVSLWLWKYSWAQCPLGRPICDFLAVVKDKFNEVQPLFYRATWCGPPCAFRWDRVFQLAWRPLWRKSQFKNQTVPSDQRTHFQRGRRLFPCAIAVWSFCIFGLLPRLGALWDYSHKSCFTVNIFVHVSSRTTSFAVVLSLIGRPNPLAVQQYCGPMRVIPLTLLFV